MPATTNEAGARGSDESAGVLISKIHFTAAHTTQSSAAGGGGEGSDSGLAVELDTNLREV